MNKELTPEEKKAFGVADEGALTPEQIAKNLENQKNIEQTQPPVEKSPEPEVVTEDSAENEVDLDTPETPAAGSIKLDDDITSESADDIIDLDNVLDKADHTYELEKDDITSAPSSVEDMRDNLEQQLAGTVPVDPEKQKAQEQAAENKQEHLSEPVEDNLSHVRTFHKDVSTLRDTGNTAVTARMLREARREEKEQKEDVQTDSQIKIFSILGVAFIIVAIGLFVYLTQFNKPTSVALAPTNIIPSLIPADVQIPIDVTGAYHFKIKSTLKEHIEQQTQPKQITHFYFGEASRNGGRLLTTLDFFKSLNVTVPISLAAVLTDEFMLGTYTTQEPAPFLILPVTSFPKAHEAMAAWEGSMLRDLKDVFALSDENVQPEAFDEVFRDSIIENQHVRLLYTPLIETLEETFIVLPPIEETVEEINEESPNLDNEGLLDQGMGEHEAEEVEIETTEEEIENIDESGDELVEDVAANQEMEESNEVDTTTETDGTDPVDDNQTTTEPETLTQVQRTVAGEDLALVYTFINEYTILITTNPAIIPEIVKQYTNRQIFLQ